MKTPQTTQFEKLIREFFFYSLNAEQVVYNHRPDWLKNKNTGKNLELDLYFPSLRLGVECNGFTHRMNEQKKRDALKRRLCIENMVTLITITHPAQLLKKRFIEQFRAYGCDYNKIPFHLRRRFRFYKPKKVESLAHIRAKIKKETKVYTHIEIQKRETEANRIRMEFRSSHELHTK